MVTIYNPNQNLRIQAPDEGQVFRNTGDLFNVFKRVGNQIFVLPKEQFAGNIQALPEFNQGDYKSYFESQLGLDPAKLFQRGNPDQFTQGPVTQTPDVTIPTDPQLQQRLGAAQQAGTPLAQLGTTPQQVGAKPLPVQPAQQTPQPQQQTQIPLSRADRRRKALLGQGLISNQQAKRAPGQPKVGPKPSSNAPQSSVSPVTPQSGALLPSVPNTVDSLDSRPVVQAPEPDFKQQVESILKEFGIDAPKQNQDPLNAFTESYKKLYEQAGLDIVQKEIKSLAKEQTDKIADINDNPYLSESLRSKKIAQVQDKYESRLNLLQSTFDREQRNAQWVADKALTLSHEGQVLNKEMMFKAIDLAEKEVAGRRSERKEFERIKEFDIRQDLAERRFERTFAGAGVQLDQPTTDLMAQTYLTTGQIPSLGFGTAGAAQRAQIFKRAAQIAGQQGFGGAEIAANKAQFAALQSSLRNQATQFNATKTALGTLEKQLGLVEQFSTKVGRTGVPALNRYVLYIKGQYAGDADTQALQNSIQTASYEFAKILSGAAASIAGVTVTSASDAQNLINANMTKGQLRKIIGLMRQESNFRLNSQQGTISDIKNQIKSLGGVGRVESQVEKTSDQGMSDENAYQLYLRQR